MLVSSLEEVSHDQLNVSSAVVAEWLRRLTRNQLRSPCTGSNPVNCDFFSLSSSQSKNVQAPQMRHQHLNDYVSLNWLLGDGWHGQSGHGRMDGWMDGWMDGRTGGWMDGWMDL